MRIIMACIFLLLSSNSEAQICFVSSPWGGERYQIPPNKFILLEEDFEFQEEKSPYTQLFVTAKSLNVRNSPNYGHIVGTVFQGDKVPVLARKGDWIAITRPIPNFKDKPQWVHINYLSPSRINTISTEDLIARCKLSEMANMLEKSLVTDNCKSVRNFIKSNDSSSARKYKYDLLTFLKASDKTKALYKVQSNCF